MKSKIKNKARAVLEPFAGALANAGITPNHITIAGLLFSVVAGIAAAGGYFGWAFVALLTGGVCDMLDGAVARSHGLESRFGAHLDSSVDRLAEGALFGGLIVYFHNQDQVLYILLSFLAFTGSFLVSYTRARAEGLGIDCSVGIMERPERMVILLLAAIFGGPGFRIALWILTPLVFYTSWQRMRHVYDADRPS